MWKVVFFFLLISANLAGAVEEIPEESHGTRSTRSSIDSRSGARHLV